MTLGESFLTRIKNTLLAQGKTAVETAKADLLRKGGNIIASTPEGQEGIREELLRRGKVIAAEIPWVPIIIGGVALYVLMQRGRR